MLVRGSILKNRKEPGTCFNEVIGANGKQQ